MRRLSVVLATAATMAACGDGASPLSGGDRAEIREVVMRYGTAWLDGDGDVVCEMLTSAMRETYQRCEREAPARMRDRESVRRPVTVSDVHGEGDEADAVISFAGVGYAQEVALRQVDGEWLIDEDLSCMDPGCGH